MSEENRFRTAIVNLALFQAKSISLNWTQEQQDCAGLVRFVYREALKKRTVKQRNLLKIPVNLYFPSLTDDTRKLFPHYPNIWEVSKKNYSSFADAENLITYNFNFISKEISDLELGDLLVFNKNESSLEPWHLMIYVGKENNKPLAIYHNGEKNKDAKIRIVSIFDLMNSPDPQWLPSKNNPFFMGIYKWKKFYDTKKL